VKFPTTGSLEPDIAFLLLALFDLDGGKSLLQSQLQKMEERGTEIALLFSKTF
jgi:hypothetical protein